MYYPDFDPVAIALGPLQVHWYGVSYLAAFVFVILYGRRRASLPWTPVSRVSISDIVFYAVLGVILGGRIGYMLFYNFPALLADPLSLLRIWQGGMSFHGGFVGVLLACLLFAYKRGIGFIRLMDFIAPLVPMGLGFGRLGNFINTELPGRITEVPWGLYYPCWAVRGLPNYCPDGAVFEPVLRHPSPLYQALAEGLVLFGLMYLAGRRPRPTGFVSGVFLASYGALRCFTEFFRSPDAGIGFLWGTVTMGQLLSVPMIACGVLLATYALTVPQAQRHRWLR